MKLVLVITIFLSSLFISSPAKADNTYTKPPLYQTGYPYIKYFLDYASAYEGLRESGFSPSFLLSLGNPSAAEDIVNYGGMNYDQFILGRIQLSNNNFTLLDTYVDYYNNITDVDNPVINCNGKYSNGNGSAVSYGPYRTIRVLGWNVTEEWWKTWDYGVDTGAAACLIVYLCEGYQANHNANYLSVAELFAGYILKLRDSTDGGIRSGPRGQYYLVVNPNIPNDPGYVDTNFYWNLKSTEVNERCLYAFQALYQATGNTRYNDLATGIKTWLKGMYDSNVGLFRSSATYDGSSWAASDFSYVATDVMAHAPLEMMFSDSFFGATQEERNQKVDKMFAGIEQRTAILGENSLPKLFKFSISQEQNKPIYGSVEWSSQMALAYLKAAQNYYTQNDPFRTQLYLNKYQALISSLETFFKAAPANAQAKIAPYASRLDGSAAGQVNTGTGYKTMNAQAALASAYFAFAKAGFDPMVLGGGPGIPDSTYALDIDPLVYYRPSSWYNSTGATSALIVLTYLRTDVISPPTLDQETIYEYAKGASVQAGDLTADELDKAMGHFDPYDPAGSDPKGNPYVGYNFAVRTYDPRTNANAFTQYLRDICHWMAYPVPIEYGSPTLTLHPNVPALVPLYGTYNHWAVIKGFSASENPTPRPHDDPFYTPDFTIYGLLITDPTLEADSLGREVYKNASELTNYLLPLNSNDSYNGMYVQVAEPPFAQSKAKVTLAKPTKDTLTLGSVKNQVYLKNSSLKSKQTSIFNPSWKKIADKGLSLNSNASRAFNNTNALDPILVKRTDQKNSDYYLLPYAKINKKGSGANLVSAVMMIDAQDGHFKEASWTKNPQVLIKTDKAKAINLAKTQVWKNFSQKVASLPKPPVYRPYYKWGWLRTYYQRWYKQEYNRWYANYIRQYYALYFDYLKLNGYLNKATAELNWQPKGISTSPYEPYWKIDANGYIWYVTQEGKTFTPESLNSIMNEISVNRNYLNTFVGGK